MLNALVMVLLFLTAVFLILLVLIQRGRGGGLAGAFGGLGGQSAFGTKAGDLFTRITIGVAAFWIILCAASVKMLSNEDSALINIGKNAATILPPAGGATKDAKSEPGAAGGGKSAPAKSAPAGSTPQSSAPATSASDSGTPGASDPATSAPEGGPKAEPSK